MIGCGLSTGSLSDDRNGLIWLPGMTKSSAIPVSISTIEGIGQVGPYHLDINGNTPDGGIRGPFQIESLKDKSSTDLPSFVVA